MKKCVLTLALALALCSFANSLDLHEKSDFFNIFYLKLSPIFTPFWRDTLGVEDFLYVDIWIAWTHIDNQIFILSRDWARLHNKEYSNANFKEKFEVFQTNHKIIRDLNRIYKYVESDFAMNALDIYFWWTIIVCKRQDGIQLECFCGCNARRIQINCFDETTADT